MIEELAIRYAPVIYHVVDEPHLPVNVDWFLQRTSLWFYDAACNPILHEHILDAPSQNDLVEQTHLSDCGSDAFIHSGRTRSKKKQYTFYLKDLTEANRTVCIDPIEWTTYYHAYENDQGGFTLQYWRIHPYNSGRKILGAKIAYHGGDWEGIHVVLDSHNEPVLVRFLGHTGITEIGWDSIMQDNDHPLVLSERNGHASMPTKDLPDHIKHETWGGTNGATVTWPGKKPRESGSLIDIGEKTNPLNGQMFIKYAGIWGSPSTFPESNNILYFASSGYWGPAYNETDMRGDGFIAAWGAGAKKPKKTYKGEPEFYPACHSK
jgi:hypothetical protein